MRGKPFLKKGVFPAPLSQKLSHKKHQNRFVRFWIDGQRAPQARFCYRYLVGTTETLHAKRIDNNNVLTFPSVCDIILHTLTRKR